MFTVMTKWGRFIASSFGEIRCCDESGTTQTDPANPVGWRASGLSCVLDGDGNNTGYVHVSTLQQYFLNTGALTGLTKANVPSEPEYIADYLDTTACPHGTVSVPVVLSISYEAYGEDGTHAFLDLSEPLVDNLSVHVTFVADTGTTVVGVPHVTIPAGTTHFQIYDVTGSGFHASIMSYTPTVTSDGKNITM